jgi:hypothetical protein
VAGGGGGLVMFRLVAWVLDRLGAERHDIGRLGIDAYLTRWILLGHRGREGLRRYGRGQKLFLHCFHRSDAEPYCHDHPFAFWSLIVAGGYWEVTAAGRKWYGPGRLLRRPASWQHRVELPSARRCWTLLWIGEKERSWGFWPECGFVPWREHQKKQEAGVPICDED